MTGSGVTRSSALVFGRPGILMALVGLGLLAFSVSFPGPSVLGVPGVAFAPLGLVTAPLDHPTRKRIFRHLRILPGDHFRSIARNLDLSIGVTRHHLHVLHRSGLVREHKGSGRSRYYTRGGDSDADRNELYERQWAYRDLRTRVLRRVRDRGGASAQEVADALRISRQLATYHLKHLVAEGRLRREGTRYRP